MLYRGAREDSDSPRRGRARPQQAAARIFSDTRPDSLLPYWNPVLIQDVPDFPEFRHPPTCIIGIRIDAMICAPRPQNHIVMAPRAPHPVVSQIDMKCHLQLGIPRYIYTFQSTIESSSSQTECFSLPIHSDSCNMGLRLCDSSIIAEILRLTAAKLLLECATAFKSAEKLPRNGRARASCWI